MNTNGGERIEDYSIKKMGEITEEQWDELEKILLTISKHTMDKHIDDFFEQDFAKLLADNTMGNMTLLTGGGQNQLVSNKSFKLKKRDVHKFFKQGQFVPIGTVLVFSDAYNDSAHTANFWLPDSRIRYLNNMISVLEKFLEQKEGE